MKFIIKYGMGGGFGGAIAEEEVVAEDHEEAELYAFEAACEYYEMYVGLHGIRGTDDIMEEDGCNEDDAQDIFNEERDTWLEFYAEEI